MNDGIRIDLTSLAADARVESMVEELEGVVAAEGRRAAWTGEFAAVGKTPCRVQGARWTAEFAAVGKATGKNVLAPGVRLTAPFSGAR